MESEKQKSIQYFIVPVEKFVSDAGAHKCSKTNSMYVDTVRDKTGFTQARQTKPNHPSEQRWCEPRFGPQQSVSPYCGLKVFMSLGTDDVLKFSAGDSIKVLPLKQKGVQGWTPPPPSSSNPRARIGPDAVCSPERSKVDPAPMNYTSPDMWRVRCCTCMQANGIPLGENWHPPQKNAKLCSIYGKKWMCALMHWKYGPLCMVGCLCRKYATSLQTAMVCQLVNLSAENYRMSNNFFQRNDSQIWRI